MTDEVFKILSTVDGFRKIKSGDIVVERLGGLTNRNYKFDCESGSYVLRIAGEGTEDYIDRTTELHNASIASRAGVNAPSVTCCNPTSHQHS